MNCSSKQFSTINHSIVKIKTCKIKLNDLQKTVMYSYSSK